jgi:hypothetical protein
MLAMHAHAGLGDGAHAVHYAIVGVGLLGLVALLTPHLPAAPHSPHEHAARVPALRSARIPPDLGRAGLAAGNLSATALDPTMVASRENWLPRAPVLTAAQRALLPLAVVSSAAAVALPRLLRADRAGPVTLR